MKQKLSVLFICGWYPSRVLPNNGDFIQRHAEAVSLKHTVTVIHIITDKNNKKDIDYTSQEINGIKTHIAYLKHSRNPLKKTILFFKAFKVLIQKSGTFDIVHLNEIFPFGIFSLYLKWFKKKPYIITEHFTNYLSISKPKGVFFQKVISKYIVKKAHIICTVTDYMSKNMQNIGFKGNYITVPNVVDTDLFFPMKKEVLFLKLLHISNLDNDQKNIDGMLRVAKFLDEKLTYFEWDFIGNNGNKYKKHVNDLDLKNGKITFSEHQTHSEIVAHLQKATVCVSFSNYETFGIVITEAIACGTPVIATNTGIASDFNELDFCKVIPIKNEQLLFETILNHETIFANIDTEKMYSFVKQKFSKEVICKKFTNLYYKTLKI